MSNPPATMRMTPAMGRLMTVVLARTAKVRIAPTTASSTPTPNVSPPLGWTCDATTSSFLIIFPYPHAGLEGRELARTGRHTSANPTGVVGQEVTTRALAHAP